MSPPAERFDFGFGRFDTPALRRATEQAEKLRRLATVGGLDATSRFPQSSAMQQIVDAHFGEGGIASALGRQNAVFTAYNDALAANRLAEPMLQEWVATLRPKHLDSVLELTNQLSWSARKLAIRDLAPSLVEPNRLSARAYRLTVEAAEDEDVSPILASRIGFAAQEAVGTSELSHALQDAEDEVQDSVQPDPHDLVIREMHNALRQDLSRLDPRLVSRLDGAWERLERPGPDSASQAAHSVQELLDWTLRMAAPDAAVLAWHKDTDRPAHEVSDGRPTRRLRGLYIVRERPGSDRVVGLHLKSLRETSSVLQKFKHEGGGSPADVRYILVQLEGTLGFLLSNEAN